MKRTIQIRSVFLATLLYLFSSVVGIYGAEATDGKDYDYWPTNGWRSTAPEAQGMDSGKLADMLEEINKEQLTIDSITIVRNGYLVLDAYPHPLFRPGTKHIIHSCTKSITSALMGIAIEKGYVKGVDQKVIDFFPEKTFANLDERKRAITVSHLLSMSHGIRTLDSFLFDWKGLIDMWPSRDWVQSILDLPMDRAPGVRYDYSNMSSFLLSAIIRRQTGINVLAFARSHLLGPLGIQDVNWPPNPNGRYKGWGDMWLTPHDMAKFGWLYLNNGYWDGRQIVPAAWVRESLQNHSFPKKLRSVIGKDGKTLYGKSAWLWLVYNIGLPFTDGYGYQWWLDDSGAFSAVGHGGQYIMVVPEKELVVVFTSVLGGTDFSAPGKLLDKYILPSIKSDREMTPVPGAQQRLVSLSKTSHEQPAPTPVPVLNETAKRISGKTYRFAANPYRYRTFSLSFEPGSSTARLQETIGQSPNELLIGLDGVHRTSYVSNRFVALKGRWVEKNVFELSFDHIGFTTRGTIRISFKDDTLSYKGVDIIRGEFELTGSLQ